MQESVAPFSLLLPSVLCHTLFIHSPSDRQLGVEAAMNILLYFLGTYILISLRQIHRVTLTLNETVKTFPKQL